MECTRCHCDACADKVVTSLSLTRTLCAASEALGEKLTEARECARHDRRRAEAAEARVEAAERRAGAAERRAEAAEERAESSASEARAAEERAAELLDAAESDRDRWERRAGDLTELLNRVREFEVRPLEVEAEMRRIP